MFKVEQPIMSQVVEVRDEAADLRTLWLDCRMEFQPGQFIMLWIPGVDEKPYTVSAVTGERIAVTVRKRGPFSARLVGMMPGERIGVRGPYGHGYESRSGGVIVAGGCGIATVAPLKDRAPETPLIFGAKSADEIIFRDRFPDMEICTDDGSLGFHGFPTGLLRRRLERGGVGVVFACGPEVMMRAVFALCEQFGVECQAALERYMKCGFGVCAQCTCGDQLVCQDGPVFGSAALRRMEEFGRTARLKSGKLVTIAEYANWKSS